MMEYALLIAVVAAVWFWFDSIHAREIAIEAGRQIASRDGLQLLDETVAVARLRAARDDMGRMRLQRTYSFEVSDTGADRLTCSLTLLGKRLQQVEIPPVRDNVVQLFH